MSNISDIVENEKIISLDERPRAVFVGDTHGDLEASRLVWESFSNEVKSGDTYLVFLGDYVDRGSQSKENIDFLSNVKKENPKGIILLLGNHDAYPLRKLRPADFWQSLSEEDYEYYKDLSNLPWMSEAEGLVATHGTLPFISELSDLESPSEEIFEKENELDLPIWVSIAWGDLNRNISGGQMDPLTGRPQFGKELVLQYMQKHDWNVLIRAHQPGMQGWSFSENVLTIFTSQAYVDSGRAQERNIAVVDLENGVKGREDVEVLSLNQL
ncbi:hypothetical protein AKJ53_00550 [candidate division MSBL1 archaeon SCGC-AAA382F02]|uniref:Serine/threonine specific protein phosphatases domain-containing protein n=1 Tax=candidate division MSBL1 archaeon SCGC-AAA382F02 TaxID=1698282 RepID=A0A133VIU7_9EURY|nr:hypothetical protein AKJ53_00550 [candidate division MSBL1 archaeon SCGC-AAA382F02]